MGESECDNLKGVPDHNPNWAPPQPTDSIGTARWEHWMREQEKAEYKKKQARGKERKKKTATQPQKKEGPPPTTPDDLLAKRIRAMGFTTYEDYLNSPLWEKIRGAVLLRDNYRCWCCHKAAAQVVHLRNWNRSTLKGEDLLFVVSLCKSCENMALFNEDGSKTENPSRVDQKLTKRTRQLFSANSIARKTTSQ
jgi:hypothetical protein